MSSTPENTGSQRGAGGSDIQAGPRVPADAGAYTEGAEEQKARDGRQQKLLEKLQGDPWQKS